MIFLSHDMGGGAVDFITKMRGNDPGAWEEARRAALKFWRSPEGLKGREEYKAKVPDSMLVCPRRKVRHR